MDQDALYLDPPHSHNPSNISHVAALPASMLSQLPPNVQDALWTLQDSTSVVYASYLRLQALLDEKFDRLSPIPGIEGQYSETSFFNYINAIRAERQYLLQDAHPDWKHKARLTSLSPYSDLPITPVAIPVLSRSPSTSTLGFGPGMELKTIGDWYTRLQAAESLWLQSTKNLVEPNFETTVAEYRIFLSTSENSSPVATPDSEYDEAMMLGAPGSQPVPASLRVRRMSRVRQGSALPGVEPEQVVKALADVM